MVRFNYLFVFVFIGCCLPGCSGLNLPFYGANFPETALLVSQKERAELHKDINAITMVVNIDPSVVPATLALRSVEEFVDKIRQEAETKKIIVKEVIRLNEEQKLPIQDKPSYAFMGSYNLSDPQLFERFVPKEAKGDSVLVLLFDACCPGNDHIDFKEIYISFALGLLKNGKRVDAVTYVAQLNEVKNRRLIQAFTMPAIGIQKSVKLAINDPYVTLLNEDIRSYCEFWIDQIFIAIENHKGQ